MPAGAPREGQRRGSEDRVQTCDDFAGHVVDRRMLADKRHLLLPQLAEIVTGGLLTPLPLDRVQFLSTAIPWVGESGIRLIAGPPAVDEAGGERSQHPRAIDRAVLLAIPALDVAVAEESVHPRS